MSEFSYKTINGKNFMLIPCKESGKNIDTQIKMLTSGGIEGILPVIPTYKNGVSILQYDITGLARLSDIIQYGKKLSHNQFAAFIGGILSALDECSLYTLSPSGIILDNDCVYFETKGERVRFAYSPTLQSGDVAECCKETLRSFIAYGKVEHDSLTASITDAINSPSFSFSMLKDILRNYKDVRPSEPQYKLVESLPQPPVQEQAVDVSTTHQVVRQQQNNAGLPNSAVTAPPIQTANSPVLPFASTSALPTMPKAKERVKKGGNSNISFKNLIIMIVTAIISLAAVVGSCFASFARTADGALDITKVLGVAILIGALDFLLLRNKLTLKKDEGVEPVNNEAKKSEKKAKDKNADKKPMGSFPPMPSPIPPAPPVPQPQPQPAAVMSHSAPAFKPAPQPASTPVFAHAYSQVPEPISDETVVAYEPAAISGLYLQAINGEIIPLSKSPFLIGRNKETSDYTLNDATVGRMHAEFSKQGDTWAIADQNSRNHTYLNEKCLNPYTPYPVSEGDTIRLANVTLWVKSR